jgi:hypothetical protein
MGKTAILAAVKGYVTEQVKPWVESLKKSGYNDKVFIIMYDKNEIELANYFIENEFQIFYATHTEETHIATQRFLDYSKLLESDLCKDVDLVIHTDIRDIIFQENPDTWLRNNMEKNKHILATSEGITYNHEDWNGDGLQNQFGESIFERYKDIEALCSGIIAGRKKIIIGLFNTIYDLAFFAQQPDGFIDQHFYNLAIHESYLDFTQISTPEESWNINFGTMVSIPLLSPDWSTGEKTEYNNYDRKRTGSYIDNMLYPIPQFIDGKVCNELGVPYTIVHQYNRYPLWGETLLETLNIFKYVS